MTANLQERAGAEERPIREGADKTPAQLIAIARQRGDLALSSAKIREAIARTGMTADLVDVLLRGPVPEEFGKQACAWAESVPHDAAPYDQLVSRYALLQLSDRDPKSMPIPDAARDARLEDLNVWLADAPDNDALQRPLVDMSSGEDIVIAASETPAAIAMVFTGLADRFSAPIPLFDRYLASLNITAIYLRDFARILYLRGLACYGEGLESTLEGLRDLLKTMPEAPLVTIGNSAGGYGAMRYGTALGARQVLGFSAATNLTEEFLSGDGRGQAYLKRLFRDSPVEEREIRPHVLAAEGRTKIDLYFGADMAQDRRHAEELNGAPGVTLHPLEGLGRHTTAGELVHRGQMLPILSSYLGER